MGDAEENQLLPKQEKERSVKGQFNLYLIVISSETVCIACTEIVPQEHHFFNMWCQRYQKGTTIFKWVVSLNNFLLFKILSFLHTRSLIVGCPS